MNRELTQEERAKIEQAVAVGDRVEATSLYISITGADLTQAQDFVRSVAVDLKAEGRDAASAPAKRGCLGIFGFVLAGALLVAAMV